MKKDDDIDRSDATTTTSTESSNGIKVPKKLEPPKRDTGIPSELDINIDIDEGKHLFISLSFLSLSLSLSLFARARSLSLSGFLNSNARRA